MSTPNFDDTSPINIPPVPPPPAGDDTSPVPVAPAPRKRKPRRWPWILLGLVFLLLTGAAGGYMGYNQAVQERIHYRDSQIALKATYQFQLALQDQQSGNLSNALKRIEYVIQIDPSYPGAAQKLTELMIAMSVTASPVPSPTVTLTPTPDLRGEEELFNTARQYLAAQDWQKTIETLDALRQLNKTYQAVYIDGMYYVSLRNRGMDKIRRGQLEEGMYDMSLTERFGPLDKEADTYRTWSRLYVTGASFWQLDWVEVINYFSQIYPSVPMLMDSSGITATERYRLALLAYGDQLYDAEDYCGAEQQYELAFQISPDGNASARATEIYRQCHPPTNTPQFIEPTLPLETFIPTEPLPEEPTVEPPVEETVQPPPAEPTP